MRALVLSEMFPPKVGGSGRYVWDLYRDLPRARFIFVAGEDPRQEAFDATHDLQVYRLPLSFPTRFVRRSSLPFYRNALKQLRRLVREQGVTCVHAARSVPEGLLAWMLRRTSGVPYVCFAHGEDVNPSNAEASPPWYRRRVYESRELALIVGLILRDASRMIANSRNTQNILSRRWRVPAERIALVHPGVDTDRFRPAPRDSALRARLGWGERPVVLTAGRLQKRKGHDTLISALPEVRRKVPDILYSIVGSGEERQALEALVAEKRLADHVQFLDEVSDEQLIHCYQQCDLFALANRQIGGDIEGFGIVLLEAQACGRPVVAGDSGGTRETMRVPDTGLVVPCDTPEALSEVVADLLSDSARLDSMGKAGRRWVTERFARDVRARQLDELVCGPSLSSSPEG